MASQDFFRALWGVATVINSSLDTGTVLDKITEQTATALNCKASTIRLLDRTRKVLLASAAYGLSDGYMRKGPVEVAKSGMDGEVLAGKTIHLRDACSDGRFQYPSAAKSERLTSVLSTPLIVGGKAIGILRVYSATERDFTNEEEDFMKAVASISAIAIENARLHEALRADYEIVSKYNVRIFEE